MSEILTDWRSAPFLAAIADPSLDREYVHGVFADFLEENGHPEEALAQRIAAVGGPELVWCPPGQFIMGSPKTEKGRNENENQTKVKHTRGFWLGKYPMTHNQAAAISYRIVEFQMKNIYNVPVIFTSFNSTRFWLKSLNFFELKNKRIPLDHVYRLPTEAEWEYACRAGTTTPTPYGKILTSEHANFNGLFPYGTKKRGDNLQKLVEVGKYPSNPWGIYDMLGNMNELCLDNYEEILPQGIDPINIRDCPIDDESLDYVCKGGCYYSTGRHCRPATRNPARVLSCVGFRICLAYQKHPLESSINRIMDYYPGKLICPEEPEICEKKIKKVSSEALVASRLHIVQPPRWRLGPQE